MKFIPATSDDWASTEVATIAPRLLLSPAQWRELADSWPQELPVGLLLDNDVDVQTLELPLARFATIALRFPKWTDGRAYSQARLLRRRLRWRGELRAAGDVVVDMALQLSRTGFDVALLRAGQDPAVARRALHFFDALLPGPFYQGDVREPRPLFLRAQVQ